MKTIWKTKNEDGNVKMKHTQVIFDESSQKFVVGKKKEAWTTKYGIRLRNRF